MCLLQVRRIKAQAFRFGIAAAAFPYFITGLQFLACKCGNVSSERSTMTKNIGMLLLAIYLILAGITTLFHVAIGAVVMGVLALVTGILILVGK